MEDEIKKVMDLALNHLNENWVNGLKPEHIPIVNQLEAEINIMYGRVLNKEKDIEDLKKVLRSYINTLLRMSSEG